MNLLAGRKEEEVRELCVRVSPRNVYVKRVDTGVVADEMWFHGFKLIFPAAHQALDNVAIASNVGCHGDMETIQIALNVEHGDQISPLGGGKGLLGWPIVELDGRRGMTESYCRSEKVLIESYQCWQARRYL